MNVAAAVLVEQLHVSTSWRSRSEEGPGGAAEPRSSPRRTEAAEGGAASSALSLPEPKLPHKPLRTHTNHQVSLIHQPFAPQLVQFASFNVCSYEKSKVEEMINDRFIDNCKKKKNL